MTVDRDTVVRALLEQHGRTYAREAGIRLANTPAPLFQHLVLSLLLATRIKNDIAVAAGRSLREAGWTTPKKMVAAGWSARTKVLNRSGYARYDESTSRMLGDTADRVLDEYGGDLRRLRASADGDTTAMRASLKQFKGIGDVGADIFLREVQGLWPEVWPFVDARAAIGAKRVGLPTSARGLSTLVDVDGFPCLVSACVRASFDKDTSEIRSGRT